MNMFTPKMDSSGSPPEQRPVALAQGGVDGEGQFVLREYLRMAWRWRWVIGGAIAAFLLLGFIVTLLMTPKYSAVSTIEISREADQVTNFKGVEKDISLADQEFYQTQYGLLQSRTLAERVANSLNFVDNLEFFDMFGAPNDPEFEQTDGRYPASGRARRQRVAGEILLENLIVDPSRRSRLVDIEFASPSADMARRVANAWAENFIRTNLERKVQSTAYGREQLQRQLAEYKDRLGQSQRQLVTYASIQGIINLPGETENAPERAILADNLSTLNIAFSQATAARIHAEVRFRQAGSDGATVEALDNLAINNIRTRRAELGAEYQRMMVLFEPGYPAAQAIQSQIEELERSVAQEEARISNSLEASYLQAVGHERALEAELGKLKGDYLDFRRRSIQYNIFQQEVATNQALYDGLLQRFKEIGVAGGVGVNNVSVVDLANTPRVPSSPSLPLNLAISLVVGLMFGAALALFLDQLEEGIRDPAEVWRRLGLPLLGTVPKTVDTPPEEALLDPKSDLVDAYLAVYTSLGFVTEHGVPRSLVVTSTRPAEGKSTTALALAAILSRAGKKVILVDGDMRSPSVHLLCGVNHDRGLSNFLAGEENISSLISSSGSHGFAVMSAGPIPPNAAELLVGNRLSLLIERLLENFDHVVIDAPPVMGLADAPLMASRVDGVIYAVESHGTRSTQIKTALNRLAAANVRVFGCVITMYEAQKSYYGDNYDYGYGYGRQEKQAELA